MRFLRKLVISLALLPVVTLCHAQALDAVAKPGVIAQVNNPVWIKVTPPDGNPVRIKTRDGEMATVFLKSKGQGIGITPSTIATKAGQVRLTIVDIDLDANQQQRLTHSAVVVVSADSDAWYSHEGTGYKIEVLEQPG